MKITVLGLWHLGSVTAACLARHHRVTGLDFDEAVLTNLRAGRAPLHEPGLDALLAAGLASGQLDFSSEPSVAAQAEVLWVCYDTPVDDEDHSEVDWVLSRLGRVLPVLRPGTGVLVSSQLPVGTCARLAREHPTLHFACSPENLRLGRAIEAFEKPARIVVGTTSPDAQACLDRMLAPLGAPRLWMRTESAEMTKHAINAFLAASITFMNEIACLCEDTGADAKEVERGLKSESRIGPQAYLSPGGAFAGGTLARDVVTLSQLGQKFGETLDVLPAIKRSNDRHRQWVGRKLQQIFANETGRCVALLGLTYKPGTNTLRRSSAVELAQALAAAGFAVRACDPSQPVLPAELGFIQFKASAAEAIAGADAVVVCTEWPEFRTLEWPALLPLLRRPLVIDAAGFLKSSMAGQPSLQYVTVGSPA